CDRRLQASRIAVGRGRRTRVDQAPEGIGAVARALGTPQNLDAVEPEQGPDAAERRKIDVVNDESQRGVGCAFVLLELAYAAQLEITGACTFSRERQIRN